MRTSLISIFVGTDVLLAIVVYTCAAVSYLYQVRMMQYLSDGGGDWPRAAESKYERIEVLGKGSFGMVWMAERFGEAEDEFDDQFVAVKNINIKDDKAKVYAEREISILQELRHPNVIRLIRSYPIHCGSRLVIMQLARGPNLHQVIIKRGALGLPLARLVSRQLVAAVGVGVFC